MTATPTDLRSGRAALTVAVEDGSLDAAEFPARFSRLADRCVAELFDEATGGRPDGLALLAVGGYGRSELAPASDLDLVLVHARRRDVAAVAEKVWYGLWDSGVRLDHSVRTHKEAVAVASADLRALLGLLEGRLVAGDAGVAEPLLAELAGLWRVHAGRLLPELHAMARARHERFGELPFLLEPDLKESAGGLRDVENLLLVARALPQLAEVMRPAALEVARGLLISARVALQCRSGAGGDRLLLEEQDRVARLLAQPGADELMAAVGEAGREVMWSSADGWRRASSVLQGPSRRTGGRPVPLAQGVELRDGEVALEAGADLTGDPALLMRLAAAAAAEGAGIAPAALDRLEKEWTVPERWPPELRDGFVSLLEHGDRAVPVLETLDGRHLLERLLPEWGHVRHLPQRNAYHRFTVDRHLLEAVARAAPLIRTVHRPDLLLLAALLHDIGKGLPGDHSSVGAAIARAVAERMGLPEQDGEVLARLVAHHLLLADTATRRDLDDPATVALVARTVLDLPTLELLAALTRADSIATGPAAWSEWKAGLLDGLVARVRRALRGEPWRRDESEPSLTDDHRRLMAAGKLAVEVAGSRVTVAAPDRPGLFSLVAGMLALHRLDIRRATAASDALGMAIEAFDVGHDPSRPPDADRLLADLAGALSGRLPLEGRLAALESAYVRARRPGKSSPPEVVVLVDEAASDRATVVEVRAADSHGLLHRLTACLAGHGLDIVSAQVQTLGHEVVDAFYVRTFDGGRPTPDDLEVVLADLAEAARAAPA